MEIKKLYSLCFSPTGTTARIMEVAGEGTALSCGKEDLTERNSITKEQVFDARDLVYVGVPVYAGRVPEEAKNRISYLKGNLTPAVAVVTYGNRNYDDALMELQDLLEERGFKVMAAAAIVTEHAMFSSIATGRPDEKDWNVIRDFFTQSMEKVQACEDPGKEEHIWVKGNRPYRQYKDIGFHPFTTESCDACGKCVAQCPAGAIELNRIAETRRCQCISCMRCIKNCPNHARKQNRLEQMLGEKALRGMCQERKETEIFL